MALARLIEVLQPKRDLVLKHMAYALGGEYDEARRRRLCARFHRHMVLGILEGIRLRNWSREQVLAATEVHGLQHLEAALSQGRGAIVIGGHQGNWELGYTAIARRGVPTAGIALEQSQSLLERVLAEIRERHGVEAIPVTELRRCFEWLREGRVLGIMIDRRGTGGIFVPFFGHPAVSPTGPAALAGRTGAPVLMCEGHRRKDGRHYVEIHPPMDLARSDDVERDLAENTARFQRALEEAIRRRPAQWIWVYRRWGWRDGQPGLPGRRAERARPAARTDNRGRPRRLA